MALHGNRLMDQMKSFELHQNESMSIQQSKCGSNDGIYIRVENNSNNPKLNFCIFFYFFSANTAAFAAGILFFLTYFPYFFLADRYETMSQSEKLLACLLGNIGMAFGCNVIMIAEGTGKSTLSISHTFYFRMQHTYLHVLLETWRHLDTSQLQAYIWID